MKKQRGGKSSPVLYPNIINEFPPHRVFWELCAGSAEITKRKRPASFSAAVDLSAFWVDQIKNSCGISAIAILGDSFDFLEELKFAGSDHLIYIDPPYLLETRPNSPGLYEFEMSREDHIRLLDLLNESTCNIVLSHYPCDLYDNFLLASGKWRKKVLNVCYHGRAKNEALYMNFPVPDSVHDLRYTGQNKAQRQALKRKAKRWVNRLKELGPQERQFILNALEREFAGKGS